MKLVRVIMLCSILVACGSSLTDVASNVTPASTPSPVPISSYEASNTSVGFQHSAAAADINGDAAPDIFVTDTTNGAFLLVNDGIGNFTVTRHGIPSIRDGYYTSELIDVDDNGYYDLLVGRHEQDGAVTRIYWGDVSGTFSASRATIIPIPNPTTEQWSGHGC